MIEQESGTLTITSFSSSPWAAPGNNNMDEIMLHIKSKLNERVKLAASVWLNAACRDGG